MVLKRVSSFYNANQGLASISDRPDFYFYKFYVLGSRFPDSLCWAIWLQHGLLATYLIPGCVGRGVELGSESLSVAAAKVLYSGNVGFWTCVIW